MTEFRGAWTEAEVEAFLRDATIPVRLATLRPDGSLWLVALWFRYRDGVLECATGADADLVRFLRADDRVAFDVSTNDVPYRGVRGNGTASVAPDEDVAVLRSLVERYLGGTDSRLARRLLDDDREEVRIRVDPAVVFSWDYTERMRDVAERA